MDSVRPDAARLQLPPETVARRTFALVRRGYDPGEVRSFLSKVAQSLADARRRSDDLARKVEEMESELSTLRQSAPGLSDESFLTERLGSEATKILKAAHDAASDVRRRADAEARKMVEAARLQAESAVAQVEARAAEQLRSTEEATSELLEVATSQARAITQRANAQAEEILSGARSEGRDILRRTKELRSEIIGDLVRRRKTLTVQVEQLHAGRDVLATSLKRLRDAVNDSAEAYARIEEEARLAARAAGARAESLDFHQGIPEEIEDSEPVGTSSRAGVYVSGSESAISSFGTREREVPEASADSTAGGSDLDATITQARAKAEAAFRRIREESAPAGGWAPSLREGSEVATPSVGDDEGFSVIPSEATGLASIRKESPALGVRELRTEAFASEAEGPLGGASEVGSREVGGEPRGELAERGATFPGWPEGEAGGVDSTAEVPAVGQRGASASPRPPLRPLRPGGRGRSPRRRRGLPGALFGGRRSEAPEGPGQLPAGMIPVGAPEGPDSNTVRVLPDEGGSEGERGVEVVEVVGGETGQAPASVLEDQSRRNPHPPSAVEAGQAPVTSAAQRTDRDPLASTSSVQEKSAASVLFSKLRSDVEADKRAFYGLDQQDDNGGSSAGDAATNGSDPVTTTHADHAHNPEESKSGDALLVERRDGMLDPLALELSRRVKRVLQDEQNEIMDKLRSGGPRSPVELLGPIDDQEYRYRRAVVESLMKTSTSGALFSTGRRDVSVSLPDDLVSNMASTVISWLRGRLTERYDPASVSVGSKKSEAIAAVNAAVTATYRECKTTVVDPLARDYAVAAFSRGMLEGAGRSAHFRWVIDDGGKPCPDCDDNVLAGEVRAWDEYPTGQTHPPAHSGCRCLIVPTGN